MNPWLDLAEHHGECPCAACRHTDDRDHWYEEITRLRDEAAIGPVYA